MTATASDLPRLPPAFRLVALETVESTNAEAVRQAAEGAEDGTLVWARSQTAGRGRQGREWTSPKGNLYLSLVLRPDCEIAQAAQLGFVAALAVAEAVGSVAPPLVETTFKWPNDVLFNSRKGAGILLESSLSPDARLDWLVLGVGINVASHPGETSFPATSLSYEAGLDEDSVVELLEAFCRSFLNWTNRWLDDGFAPIRETWLQHAVKRGEVIEVRFPDETLTGTFTDLDPKGRLVLTLPDGAVRTISAGDVYFGR